MPDARPLVWISLDQRDVEVAAGTTILQAARSAGIEIPTLCHDTRLRPTGGCRLCLVAVAGLPRLVPACTTAIRDHATITTHSEALERFRRTELEWHAANVRPADFEAAPEKALHRLMCAYGVPPKGPPADPIRIDNSIPQIRVDMDQCIKCLRCVRICAEVQGEFVWHAVGRGSAVHIIPTNGQLMAEGGCVACGACADSCPTAALVDSRAAPPQQWTRTVCPYCGVGCELEVGTVGNRIVASRPVLGAPVSKGHLCIKGRYAYEFPQAPDRQTQPLIRDGGRWKPASWEMALQHCAAELTRVRELHGPDAIGVLGSARATNEDNYVTQKFARVVLGTNNVDCCARVCHAPSAAALKAMLGAGAGTNSFDDIERAGTIMVIGANPLECHPIVGARIRQQRLRGKARLIVIDPRRSALAEIADVHLALRPGTNIPVLNAMANVVLEEGLIDKHFVRTRVDGLGAFREHLRAWTPERAAAIAGIDPDDIRSAARLYATARPSYCAHGLGVTEHVQGTEGVMTIINLALLTGNVGRPGAGVNPLRGQNNVQGSAHMGCEPRSLTGGASIESRRELFERVWRAPIPPTKGLTVVEMIDAAASGRLKALWAIGYDILLTLAQEDAVARALAKLELLVVQDLFLNGTAASGHVFLPVAAAYEKTGTFMNAERRIQLVRQAVASPGAVLPDWQIVCRLAALMGHGERFAFGSPEAIWDEVRAVWPEGAGISYARLEQGGLQWPCRNKADPGTQWLHAKRFGASRKATLRPIDHQPSPEGVSDDYPFVLMTGRSLYQFNVGTMTRRATTLIQRPTDMLDICPEDAARLGLADGEDVHVQSRYGAVVLPLRTSASVRPGQLFATFHDPGRHLNRLTGPYRDSRVGAPEYKVTAVRLLRPMGN